MEIEHNESDDDILGVFNSSKTVKNIEEKYNFRPEEKNNLIYNRRGKSTFSSFNRRQRTRDQIDSKIPFIDTPTVQSFDSSKKCCGIFEMRHSTNKCCGIIKKDDDNKEQDKDICWEYGKSIGLMGKYQKMKELKEIKGFVVNVHDATNFDIDFELPDDIKQLYTDVISNTYTYYDLNSDFVENPNFSNLTSSDLKIGTTYRCRLKGIGLNLNPPSDHLWKNSQMCINIKQLIDRTDGWVVCNLSDVDIYKRLLVDIVVHTTMGPVNIRDFVLDKVKHEENPIFYPYTSPYFNSKFQI